jgi:glycosyltransferase involved in cell wall biosynthesis
MPDAVGPDAVGAEVVGPKLLLVTRRFWPLTDDAAGRMVSFAEGLSRTGIRPTILAVRYASSWPTELTFRELEIVRPMVAPRSDWSMGLYLRGLGRWLREHAAEYDLFYVDSMREEAGVLIDTARAKVKPVIARGGGNGEASDWIWAGKSRSNRKAFNQSLRADQLIAPTAVAARNLISAGAERQRVVRIDDGIPTPIRRERSDCLTARAVLSSVNSDLRVPGDGKVILVNAGFETPNRLFTIANAIAPLCDRYRDLRVWFVGDGSQRDSLHHHLCDLGIRNVTAMPGSFWHIDELVCAADIVVVPSEYDSLEHRLPMTISAAVPIVVANTPELRTFFPEHREATNFLTVYSPDDSLDLRAKLQTILSDLFAATQKAIQLRTMIRRKHSREQTIETYARLFAGLLPSHKTSSIGRPKEATS